ncbi:type III secretion system translocon subunit SctE [Bordetella sp. LUAb4]|uniref:type III secretion system translocon subunit SctE n=1 Tax=Bordetella sp. LUAb4 TaxID=2843195 RepID=UPI001E5F0234|nr:type III secretion system translocon subunit SctE [Bordetella sp. LUAb4]
MLSVQTTQTVALRGVPGLPGIMPLNAAAVNPSLDGLTGEDSQDFPSLQDQTPVSNSNGAPPLTNRYTSAADAQWATMDIMAMIPAIDAMIGTGYSERMSDSSKTLKSRIEANESMREAANQKRADEHKKRDKAKHKSIWARIAGLVTNVVTTVFLAVAVAASVASGVGVMATPMLTAMLVASTLGIVEKSVQLAGKEDFSITGMVCSAMTKGLKWLGLPDDVAEKLGNVIGSAIMIGTVVGVLNDPSAVGRLVSNELKLLGVPDKIADIVNTVMTIGATVAVMCFSFSAAKASASAMGGFSKLASNLNSGMTIKNIAVASDVGGQLINAGAGTVVAGMNGSATLDGYSADKSAIQTHLLQNQMKENDRYSTIQNESLKRMVNSLNDWRDSFMTMLGAQGDVMQRLTGSFMGDGRVKA